MVPEQRITKEGIMAKKIKETKCTCNACGRVWYYGKEEVTASQLDALSNISKTMMCCGGCLPAILIADKKVVDLNKCPDCGSKAVLKEEVVHEV
jgi:DNA-directed RNA polymerase subunit RPC12/RpoP